MKKSKVLHISLDTCIYLAECTVMPWYLKAVWVQFNINTPVALVITILFYLFIPNGKQQNLDLQSIYFFSSKQHINKKIN